MAIVRIVRSRVNVNRVRVRLPVSVSINGVVAYWLERWFGRRTFPILRQTAGWMSDYLAVKLSAIGQPTWPTQPSIPQGSVNE